MDRPTSTADLARQGRRLALTCLHCGHQARLGPDELRAMKPARVDESTLGRCSVCDRLTTAVAILPPGWQPDRG